MPKFNDFTVIVPGATGLQNEPRRHPRDYVLGSENPLSGLKQIVFPDGHGWLKFSPTSDYQRVANGDLNICVTESCVNGYEYSAEYLRSQDVELDAWFKNKGYVDTNDNVKFNNRIVAQGSKTDPNNGNTTTNVVEFIRTNGLATQSASPWDNNWTREQFYSPVSQAMLDSGKQIFQVLTPAHEWVNTSGPFSQTHTPAQLIEALKYGCVRVSVDGSYELDSEGLISSTEAKQGKLYYWNHSVLVVDYDYGKSWTVHDHYTNQIIKFRWGYPFGNGKLLYFINNKKKVPTSKYIQVGKTILFRGLNGIYKDKYVSFGTGDVLKALFGDYPVVGPRETVNEIPPNFIGELNITLK